MIEIDGAYGESGGQILRTSVGLSAITCKKFKIINIRKGRPKPGLYPQHLAAIRAVAELCGTKLGAKIGDTSLVFEPGKIKGGHYDIDIGTAGAISLVLQSLILPSLHAEKNVSLAIRGGTHVRWSPSMDYMQHVFGYYMKKIGLDIVIDIAHQGFYPKGNGLVNVKIKPGMPKPLCLTERGELARYYASSIATEDLKKSRVAERQLGESSKEFKLNGKSVQYVKSASTGSSLHLSALYDNCILGSSSIGERGKKAEDVGKEALNDLKKQIDSGACFDSHMADQILPFLAFAKGESVISVAEITEHVKTNIWVIEQFLPVKFEIDEKEKTITIIKK